MATKEKADEPQLARCPPAFEKILAEEDVVADRRDPLEAPTRRDVARVEEERITDLRFLEVAIDDPGDRDRGLPLAIVVADMRQPAAMNELKLAAL